MSLLKVNEVTDLGGDVPTGVGKILQVVSTTKTDTFSTTSTSFVDVTGLSVTITPSSTANKILVTTNVALGSSDNANVSSMWKISGGNTSGYIGDSAGSRTPALGSLTIVASGDLEMSRAIVSMAGNYLDSPATTSPVTYKVQLARPGAAGGAYLNRSASDTDSSVYARGASTITVMEVAG